MVTNLDRTFPESLFFGGFAQSRHGGRESHSLRHRCPTAKKSFVFGISRTAGMDDVAPRCSSECGTAAAQAATIERPSATPESLKTDVRSRTLRAMGGPQQASPKPGRLARRRQAARARGRRTPQRLLSRPQLGAHRCRARRDRRRTAGRLARRRRRAPRATLGLRVPASIRCRRSRVFAQATAAHWARRMIRRSSGSAGRCRRRHPSLSPAK